MRDIFCGNGTVVPAGYRALGTRYDCLRKGFGAGMYVSRAPDFMPLLVLALLALLTVVVVYFATSVKDESVTRKDDPRPATYF